MQEIRHKGIQNSADAQKRYNEIYQKDGLLHRDSYYLWLLSLINPKPGMVFLDISCGQGRLVQFARARGLDAVGVDFAETGIRFGQRETPDAIWVVGDGEKLPIATASVDYVAHIGSLEHYEHPKIGVQEIARVLKPNGKACILLPNSYGLFGNIKNVWRKGDIFDDGQPLQRYNTRVGWQNIIFSGGLQTYRTIKYEREWPRTWVDFLWYLRSPQKIGRLFISWFIPINLSNCIVYLCKVKAKI